MTSGSDFWCDKCDFSRQNVRGIAYTTDEQGNRIFQAIEKEGDVYETVCTQCSYLWFRAPQADPPACPNCNAQSILEIQQLQNRPCPFCKKGTIISNQLDLFQ